MPLTLVAIVILIIILGIVSTARKRKNYSSSSSPNFMANYKRGVKGEIKKAGTLLCLACNGTGKVREKCPFCFGHGKQTCTSCGGMGRKNVSVFKFGKSSFESQVCHSCGGSGRQNCFACGGRGFKSLQGTCQKCHGTGHI